MILGFNTCRCWMHLFMIFTLFLGNATGFPLLHAGGLQPSTLEIRNCQGNWTSPFDISSPCYSIWVTYGIQGLQSLSSRTIQVHWSSSALQMLLLTSQNADQCLGSFRSITYSEYVVFVIQVNLLGGDVHRDGYGVQAPQIPLTGMGAWCKR